MTFSKKRLATFDTYESVRRERLSPRERAAQNRLIEAEARALNSLQAAISKQIDAFMKSEGIGINELTRRLRTSSRQTSRIMKGQANITLATLAALGAVMNKKPKVEFK
jgi:hypothetical protein